MTLLKPLQLPISISREIKLIMVFKNLAMMNLDRQEKEMNLRTNTVIKASEPSVPMIQEPEKPRRKSSDPSSTTRNNRYPVPSFFEQRLEMVE